MAEAFEDPIGDLQRVCDHDPGNPAFPALAELLRRAGRIEDAVAVTDRGLAASPNSADGRLIWLLLQIEAGGEESTRERLEAWAHEALGPYGETPVAPVLLPEAPETAPTESVDDSEFERAFAAATPEIEEMITPDRVAAETAMQVDPLPEADDEALEASDEDPLGDSGTFATATMADLLERQGDTEGAARIRANLEEMPEAETPPLDAPPEAHLPAIAALERWLENVRRMQ